MKKKILSLLSGLILGGLISYTFMDYESSNYIIKNYYGLPEKEVKEFDIYYLFNATLIVLITSFVIYVLWSLIDKKTRN
ncbi:hypothetical protein D1B31_18585 [Neobacillus notoginsengisoli]|uniref:Uncharacterized protein n=1 Tax=Neobacillus notoginsengisoli TaxID=1578198 RepID=A0A417YQT9_9BACI|nr:hypothetical protein [Neobacillus notoginsengisoli]RHW36086.1 hypothetical protein D1B31_18585 [Neobacillus notoginsengisoli]